MKKKFTFFSVNNIVTIYVIAILTGMLLIYQDFYFNILETKFTYYCICTILMLLLIGGYWLLTGQFTASFKHLSPVDISVILWGICILLSTILSPAKELAFWGKDDYTGRYTGCFLLMLYIAAYFCITRYYKASERHMFFFLAASILMCFLGITDFFDMDLLHFKEELNEIQRYIFTSTIGNINTYTSCVAMSMAVFGVLFASAPNPQKTYLYGVGVFITYIALILGDSDNAYLSLAAFFCFLPFYIFRFKGGITRYFVLVAEFFTAAKGISFVQSIMAQQVVPIHGLFRIIAEYKYLTAIIFVLWAIVFAVCWAEYKTDVITGKSRTLLMVWGVLFLLVCGIIACAIYDVNVLGNGERYGRIKEYLLFNDDWGTHRAYIWRIALEDYRKFPLMQKIFGYGPDTFGIITMTNNYPEMVERYSEIFDSVHNEYLQYFITIGPMGLLSYLAIHVTLVIQTMKRKINNPLAVAGLLAVLCYAAQAAVNINQPIATPVMWTLLSVSASIS